MFSQANDVYLASKGRRVLSSKYDPTDDLNLIQDNPN